MTDQEVFNRVKEHLLTQNERAMFNSQCRYRARSPKTGQTIKCAIGCLIIDQLYDPRFEGTGLSTIFGLIYQSVVESLGGFEPSFDMLARLQRIHDVYPTTEWESELSYFKFNSDGEFVTYES